jgi:hypothetical protein
VGAVSHPNLILSIHISWLGFLGICYMFVNVELFAFGIAQGESAAWQEKVIWHFISRAALLPEACFKLNPDTKISIILIVYNRFVRHKFVFFFPFFHGGRLFCVITPQPSLFYHKKEKKRKKKAKNISPN